MCVYTVKKNTVKTNNVKSFVCFKICVQLLFNILLKITHNNFNNNFT